MKACFILSVISLCAFFSNICAAKAIALDNLQDGGDSKTLSMNCLAEYYIKLPAGSPKDGTWNQGVSYTVTVALKKYPGYPNPNDPRVIWIGEDVEEFGGAKAVIDFTIYELNQVVQGYSNTISISRDGTTAESEGTTHLRSAFRTKDNGVGIVCDQIDTK